MKETENGKDLPLISNSDNLKYLSRTLGENDIVDVLSDISIESIPAHLKGFQNYAEEKI
jgi:hypothetical protein